MNNLKNRWYNRLIIRFFFRKELKKKSTQYLNKIYLDLIKVKNGQAHSIYPKWQIDIAIDVVIKERAKRDKSK